VSSATDLEVVAELNVGPGNITVTPDNRMIISLHPFYSFNDRVVELRKDGKLVGWDTVSNRLHKVINLTPPGYDNKIALPKTAFVNDLAVDTDNKTCYLSHSGGIKNSGLVVVDLETGRSRYLLLGHKSGIILTQGFFSCSEVSTDSISLVAKSQP
jgi:hypothetical protein